MMDNTRTAEGGKKNTCIKKIIYWVKDDLFYRSFTADIWLIILIFIIVTMGLITLTLVGFPISFSKKSGDSTFFIRRQLFFALSGIVIMCFVSFIRRERFVSSKYNLFFWFILVLGILLTVILAVKNHGNNSETNRSILGIEPTEITKLAVITTGAHVFSNRRLSKPILFNKHTINPNRYKNSKFRIMIEKLFPQSNGKGFFNYDYLIYFLFWFIFAAFVFFAINHLSASIIIFSMALVMIFIGDKNEKRKKILLVCLLIFGIVGAVFFLAKPLSLVHEQKKLRAEAQAAYEAAEPGDEAAEEAYDNAMTEIDRNYNLYIRNGSENNSISFRRMRIIGFLDDEYDVNNSNRQPLNGLYAIANGGISIFGRGINNSVYKYNYVSEDQNDMIFCIYAEETGIVGVAILFLMYFLIVGRIVKIGNHAGRRGEAMLCYGVATQIALEVVLNIAVCLRLIINTGITLPFFSSGGSALWAFLVEIGIVLSVSRKAKMKKLPEINIGSRKSASAGNKKKTAV